jgi:hypothetical protein
MPMHIFYGWWSALLFCCASRSRWHSNLNWIQIGLGFRKDLKIKKAFSSFYLAMARIRPSQAEPAAASLTRGPGAAQRQSSPTPRRVVIDRETPPTEISMKSNELMNPSGIWELGDRALHAHEIINPKPYK